MFSDERGASACLSQVIHMSCGIWPLMDLRQHSKCINKMNIYINHIFEHDHNMFSQIHPVKDMEWNGGAVLAMLWCVRPSKIFFRGGGDLKGRESIWLMSNDERDIKWGCVPLRERILIGREWKLTDIWLNYMPTASQWCKIPIVVQDVNGKKRWC